MWSQIDTWDKEFLMYVQTHFSNPHLDTFFLMITNLHREFVTKWVLFPFLILLIIKTSKSFWWSRLLMIIVGILLSDMIGHRVFKPNFERPRPIYEATLAGKVRYVGEAHGYSFPSNHAMNMFLSATLLSLFYRRKFWLFYSIAGLVAYSRVYLGVHYPSDIISGALFGTLLGLLLSHFWPFAWREKSVKL